MTDKLIQELNQSKNVKSKFLQDFYENQKLGQRQGYDPRDPNGRRLSTFWEFFETQLGIKGKKKLRLHEMKEVLAKQNETKI